MVAKASSRLPNRNSKWYRFKLQLNRGKYVYLMLIPAVVWFTVFSYLPMYGIIIAFQDFLPGMSFFDFGNFVGLKHFREFFSSPLWVEKTKNTLFLNLWELMIGFPAPILFALLLNELRSKKFKRFVQTISYLPHFIALVIVMGIVTDIMSSEGLFNIIAKWIHVSVLGKDEGLYIPTVFLNVPKYFRPIYVLSGVWQSIGWGSIIYLSALSAIDVEQYEAAEIDGAGRFRKMWSITLPGISPTIIIMLIFAVGSLMNFSFEKLLLLYKPLTYSVSDTLGTYIYRKGIGGEDAGGGGSQYGFAAAINLMATILNFMLVVTMNKVSRKLSETSLW